MDRKERFIWEAHAGGSSPASAKFNDDRYYNFTPKREAHATGGMRSSLPYLHRVWSLRFVMVKSWSKAQQAHWRSVYISNVFSFCSFWFAAWWRLNFLTCRQKTSFFPKMSTSSSYVPCHSQVDPVYFETSNDVRMQQECSTFSETSSIQNTPSSDLVKVELQDSELWKKFHHLTNEMIVNKQGRWVTKAFLNVICMLFRCMILRF